MTDEQLEKLLEALKPAEKTRWQSLMDNTLGVLIGALVVGFFGLLWQLSNDTDKRVSKLESRAGAAEQSVLGVEETFKKEIGNLAGLQTMQVSIKEAVVGQNKAIQELDNRLAALEHRNTNTSAGIKPLPLWTNDPLMKLQPFPTLKSEEVIKAVREKEEAIDKSFRAFEQRGMPGR